MKIRAILACDDNWGIGKQGSMPWPLNMRDLRWFKEATINQSVVMGRKTWEDKMMPKPLPNRRNIVVAKQEISTGANCQIIQYNDLESMLRRELTDVWIIGGATLLKNSLHFIDEIWLSSIIGDYSCDVFLPKEHILDNFTIFETYSEIEKSYNFSTIKYRRNI